MKYKGRIITIFIVLIINLTYIIHYYIRDGFVSWIEVIGLPIILLIAWWFGKQFDQSQYFSKLYFNKQIELQTTNEELEQNKRELFSIFDNQKAFIWSADIIKQKETVSKGIEEMFGYSQKEFEDNFGLWLSCTYPDDKDLVNQYYKELLLGKPSQCKCRIISSDGRIKWIESYGNPISSDAGETVKITGVAYDITERIEAERMIKHMAYHDQLTGLPNRYMVQDNLENFLSFCNRNNTELAVMFLDLDGFKDINDQMGHEIGDVLLKQVAMRLTQCLHEGAMVARFGGDEFLILLNDIKKTHVIDVAERVLEVFNQSFLLNEDKVYISTSIGISLYPHDGKDIDTLIKNADAAMYSAKKAGKNNYKFHSQDYVKS